MVFHPNMYLENPNIFRTLRKFFQYVQEAMPVRMRAIHVLNTEPVLDKLMLLIRPFMDKKFFDMVSGI